MAKLASPSGVEYCIDTTEVTQSQYKAFLDAKGKDVSGQTGSCASNVSYQPEIKKLGDPPVACPSDYWDPVNKANWPVKCIDFCDAKAYCTWAGKRLCGKVGGGAISDKDLPAFNDANQSQWYNACSQGGKTIRAYGDDYNPDLCLTFGPVDGAPGCHAPAAPFSEVLNLSGNLGEFEDVDVTGEGAGLVFRASKGGTDATSYRCDGIASPGTDPNVSFRCCADL